MEFIVVRSHTHAFYLIFCEWKTHVTNYLAQTLCFWTGIIFIRVYVSVCVCVRVYINYLKKFLTDFDETWQDDVK